MDVERPKYNSRSIDKSIPHIPTSAFVHTGLRDSYWANELAYYEYSHNHLDGIPLRVVTLLFTFKKVILGQLKLYLELLKRYRTTTELYQYEPDSKVNIVLKDKTIQMELRISLITKLIFGFHHWITSWNSQLMRNVITHEFVHIVQPSFNEKKANHSLYFIYNGYLMKSS